MSNDLRIQSDERRGGGLKNESWRVVPGSGSSPSALPPGFLSSKSGGKDERVNGDALRAAAGLSAPPPPGFNSGPGAKGHLSTNDLLWSTQQNDNGNGRDGNDLGGSGGRTSSFTNLAAALGSGLAESMEDATRGEHKGALLTDNFFYNPKNDLNYARQSRHAASRLLGTSPSKDAFSSNRKSGEGGSLFSGFDSGERPLTRKSHSSQPALFGDFSKSGPKRDAGTGLSAAFSNDNIDQMAGFRSYHPKSNTSFDGKGDLVKSRLTLSKELGVTVMEPDSYGRGGPSPKDGGRGDPGTYGIERDMQKLWSNRGSEADFRGRSDRSLDMHSQHSTAPEPPVGDLGELQKQAEEDLRPYTWDVRHHEASRALAIMYAASIPSNELRAVCESFGVVETFRSDFVDRGVLFVSYYDIRCAQYAAAELQPRLQRGDSSDRVLVQFCVPLNSSSQNDESLVVLNDIPRDMNIESLASMLSSYGAVRSLKSLGGNYGGSSFVVEYQDVQDAKQAVLELESTQPWGPDVSVEVGTRNPSDRKRGRELLALIGRWRHGGGGGGGGRSQGRQHRNDPNPYGGPPPDQNGRGYGHRPPPEDPANANYLSHSRHDPRYDRGPPEPKQQLVLGPDGRYSYVVVNHGGYPQYGNVPPPRHGDRAPHGAHPYGPGPGGPHHGPPGNQYWPQQSHHFSAGGSVMSASSHGDNHYSGHYPSGSRSVPYYGDAGSMGSHSHMMSVPPQTSTATSDEKDNRHLMLDLDAVENGRDTRTSLMVRNIPNKYTQQMLLSEFTENGHGPGVIDFFYLPIDFKNRCNRGYAFINFVEYRDILPFHRRYYGKHWRTFNSDKICDITYARIQGKSAMLKRFENSALMEKDDEYKPLVFVSHGSDKGSRLPFPDPSNKS